jgi:GDPmannose 4,6-dehydratase
MTGEVVVAVDPRYFRPTEVEALIGNARRAQEELGWMPQISFQELVVEMMQAEMQISHRNAALVNG